MTRRGAAGLVAGLLAAAVILPGLAGAIFLATLNPALVKAQLIAAVQHATGRQFSAGTLRVRMLPDITVDADDVALANPAGFSRGQMITARHLHGRVALLPLLGHRVVVRELTLTGADMKLERVAGQAPNWRFSAARPAVELPRPARTGAKLRLRLDGLTVLGLTLADGVMGWQSPAGAGQIGVTRLRLREINASSTIFLSAALVVASEPVALSGAFGGQNHLWNAQDRESWPVELRMSAAAGDAEISGAMTRPQALAGYDLSLTARGTDLGRLAAPWPWLPVPRLRDAVLSTRVIDRLDGIDVPRLALTAGSSDLSAIANGLRLNRLEVVAPNIDGTNGTQPNRVSAAGLYAGQVLTVGGTLGPVGRLAGRGQAMARGPITLDVTAAAAGATAQVRGRVAPSGNWAGTDATLHADIPDLAALSPLVRRGLPALRDVVVDASLQSTGGMLVLREAHLVLPQAELRAEGSASLGGRPRYAGRVAIVRLDLDGLIAALPRPSPHPSVTPLAAPTKVAAAAMPAARPAVAGPAWIIPDRPLPLDRLRGFDADLSVTAEATRYRGVAIDGASGRARLEGGRLTVDPFTARIGGAVIAGSLTVDARHAPALSALVVHAPDLDAAQVGALLGNPAAAAGRLTIDARLEGSGDTAHALAGTLSGHLGLALTGGTLDNRVLSNALELVTPVTRIGLSLPGSGSSEVACFATRMDVRGGIAVPRAFLLDARRFRVAAAGGIDLGNETFALRVRPFVKLGGTGLVLPSRADGPWRDPHLTLEAAGGAASAANLASRLLGAHGGALGSLVAGLAQPGDAMLGLADSGDCGPALAAARDTETAAATPLPASPATPAAKSRRERAIDLLRRLVR